jgi:hypothetical protein
VTAELTPRLLLFHKQGTSARTRFLRFGDSLLALAPLPAGAVLRDEEAVPGRIRPHPAALLKQAEEKLGLPGGSLLIETEFSATLDTPQGEVPVLLAGFTTLDPPFAAAESLGGRFVALTEVRGLPATELELVRRAYTAILG